MSVNWSWKAKFGEIDLTVKTGEEKSFVLDLYYANCLFCMIYESPEMKKEKQYQFIGFFGDEEHLKRCVGLSKEKDNMFKYYKDSKGELAGENWNEIRIDMANKDKDQIKRNLKIGNILVKAGFRVVYDSFNYNKEDNVNE